MVFKATHRHRLVGLSLMPIRGHSQSNRTVVMGSKVNALVLTMAN